MKTMAATLSSSSSSSLLEKDKIGSIPSTIEEITVDWFSKVTSLPVLRPKTFKIKSNVYSGIGSLSQIVQVEFEDDDTGLLQSFLIKLLPLRNTDYEKALYEIIISENMHGREVFFYKTLKQELVRIIPELNEYFLNCYHAETRRKEVCLQIPEVSSSVLIFQDMKPLGYTMPTLTEGLMSSHFHSALTFIAKFHFASEILQSELKNGSLLTEIYPELKDWHSQNQSTSSNLLQQFKSLAWFTEGLEFVTKNLFPEESNKIITHESNESMNGSYRKLIPYGETIIQYIIQSGSKYPTLIHDDLWPHNFLCHQDGSIKVIDWQLLGFTDSTYDLSHFLLSSLPISDINQEKLILILNQYYKIIEDMYSTCSSNHKPKRSINDFIDFFFTNGLQYALQWFAMSSDSIYANEAYRPKLYRIFEFLWEMKIPQLLYENIKH